MPKKYVAKIVIEGTIEKENKTYEQKWLLNTIEKIKGKKNTIGIMLYINSPGGGAYESQEAYDAIMEYKKKTGHHVYAYFASLAASGGYLIGCAADKIIANQETLTGSIGVMAGRFVDISSLMERYGIKAEIIHTGKNKTMGIFFEPTTDEQRAIMQSVSDECYENFVTVVEKGRKLDRRKVYELADGRVYTAKQALKNGLIDEIATFGKALDIMDEDLFKDEEVVLCEYKKKEKKSLVSKIIKGTYSASDPIQMFSQILKADIPFPAFYFDSGRFNR